MQSREIDHSKEIVGPHCGKYTLSLEAEWNAIVSRKSAFFIVCRCSVAGPVVVQEFAKITYIHPARARATLMKCHHSS